MAVHEGLLFLLMHLSCVLDHCYFVMHLLCLRMTKMRGAIKHVWFVWDVGCAIFSGR